MDEVLSDICKYLEGCLAKPESIEVDELKLVLRTLKGYVCSSRRCLDIFLEEIEYDAV